MGQAWKAKSNCAAALGGACGLSPHWNVQNAQSAPKKPLGIFELTGTKNPPRKLQGYQAEHQARNSFLDSSYIIIIVPSAYHVGSDLSYSINTFLISV